MPFRLSFSAFATCSGSQSFPLFFSRITCGTASASSSGRAGNGRWALPTPRSVFALAFAFPCFGVERERFFELEPLDRRLLLVLSPPATALDSRAVRLSVGPDVESAPASRVSESPGFFAKLTPPDAPIAHRYASLATSS